MMQSMPLKCGSNIKATMLWVFSHEDFTKLKKGHNTLMIFATIIPCKISISWSNSPHWSGGTTISQWSYFVCIVPMIAKTTNNAFDNNHYLLLWFKKHWWTTQFGVSVIVWAIAHVSLLGTLACENEFCWM
jgi:hypothetical protein